MVEYNPAWPSEFENLAGNLDSLFGGLALAIDHIGSTSVPGLAAKDCIDVQVRVNVLHEAQLSERLAAAGFRLRREPWNTTELTYGQRCSKLVFAQALGARSCNIHVREGGAPNARFALLFRDYLRSAEDARLAWGAFKQRLAQTVTDLSDYGQIKAPATDILMQAAERWAAETGWSPDVP